MKIIRAKKGDKIVVEIPLWQPSYDAIGQYIGNVPNVIGVICGDEQGLFQVNDLGYKGDQQIGGTILNTCYSREDFIKLCKKLEIEFHEYLICAYCHEPIFGSFTSGSKGNKCYNCEGINKKNKKT